MEMRDNAFKWLKANYNADYAPDNGDEAIRVEKEPPPKVRKLASDMFLDDDEDEEMQEEEERDASPTSKSEVEEYLFLSQIPFTVAFDLLDW